ncbi:DUF4402 domain-containing protein [uncultured Bacteroides sp.]|uniref:DUF4402 domain-containing protein n=1 Tax=uncultured Bacteroides sp. TaxID=162156 RepID=UPI002AAB1EAF|nr:DUF4402 domain-containing protein [uncultured Bacteroides sp.]
MKNKIVFLFAIATALALPNSIMAQASGTLTSKASAEIVAPLTIVDNSGLAGGPTLNFGAMTISATAGSCILSTSNVRTASGGVTVVTTSPSSNSSFGITGKKGATYAITLPATDITITREGGTETMTVGSLTALPASSVSGDKLTGVLDATNGTDTFTVGGTLAVGASQAEGIYNGTFSVTVAYN